jgi:DNA mismatch repair protein MutS2
VDDNPAVGTPVQTPLGKGVVREVRNNGRLLVDVGGRSAEFHASGVTRLAAAGTRARRREAAPVAEPDDHAGRRSARDIDLHGLTVEQALARIEDAVNRALLGDALELRVIHGRSGGRLRAALHRWLRGVPSVRAFHLDPRNSGVTVVIF